jgi:PleD family two-component response regulator
MNTEKPLLIGVSDVFFYTKIRDAFRPQGYTLERLRKQEDIIEKVSSLQPLAVILNMNDDQLNTPTALQTLKGHETYKHIPVLAFANHEEVETWRQAKDLGINKIVSRNEFSSRTLALVEELIGKDSTP